MYLNHFGLSEAPYRITPHTDFFFEGANRGTTLDALIYTITHDEGIVKVTGEVGSGKTMLCRMLMERLPQNVETIYLANPSLGRDEIMMAISDDLKVAAAGQRSSVLLRALQEGYLSSTSGFLTESEKNYLVLGGAWITGEQALRFLTDWLAGDVYYKITHPEHNLTRTKNQLSYSGSS